MHLKYVRLVYSLNCTTMTLSWLYIFVFVRMCVCVCVCVCVGYFGVLLLIRCLVINLLRQCVNKHEVELNYTPL
jgi:hypothetical protein